MSEFTAQDVKNALEADGVQIDGEDLNGESAVHELWWGFGKGSVVDTLDLGKFTVVEEVVGKKGEVTSNYGGNIWNNYLILKHENGRTFRLNGEYDSWDAKGWDGTVEEVEEVEKTVKVWEVKHDY